MSDAYLSAGNFMNALAPAAPVAIDTWEQARHLMVEQQIRTWEVLDPLILNTLYRVKREAYVPTLLHALAFVDAMLPLKVDGAPEGEVMLPPKMEARVLQAVAARPTDRVLEIGTGSGYMAALLAAHAAQVTSVEINETLLSFAQHNLQRNAVKNVQLAPGNGINGWGTELYDVIVISGGISATPEALLKQLAPGGRALAFVGEAPVLQARLYHKTLQGRGLADEALFDTWVPALHQAPHTDRFVF